MALSSGNVCKHEFLTDKNVLLEKDMLDKAATIKRFEYLPLCSEFEKQTHIAETQYQNQTRLFEPNKKEEDKTKT